MKLTILGEESLALRLKDEDSKLFVYTSDTGFSEDLALFAKDAALLLMECSFRRNKTVQMVRRDDRSEGRVES